jgi:hypothetical protein
MEKTTECAAKTIEKGVVVMYVVLSASQLMKASEVRKIYEEMRNNPDIVGNLEVKTKEKLKQQFGKKEKAAS